MQKKKKEIYKKISNFYLLYIFLSKDNDDHVFQCKYYNNNNDMFFFRYLYTFYKFDNKKIYFFPVIEFISYILYPGLIKAVHE